MAAVVSERLQPQHVSVALDAGIAVLPYLWDDASASASPLSTTLFWRMAGQSPLMPKAPSKCLDALNCASVPPVRIERHRPRRRHRCERYTSTTVPSLDQTGFDDVASSPR